MATSLRDFHNYWVWSDRIDGSWSDPVYLNSSGFDPALFHDDDGTGWLLSMLWDHRPGRRRFAGVLAQQMDLASGVLIGRTPPHLRRNAARLHRRPASLQARRMVSSASARKGAQGGAMRLVMARSRSLQWPYEVHPDGVVLTSANKPQAQLARAGHGDLVQTRSGETWMVYLCGRPLAASDRCVLGRETAIQPMRWGEDGWLRTEDGSGTPLIEVDGAGARQ
jgi:xylan 1,4-beta-xylosidase